MMIWCFNWLWELQSVAKKLFLLETKFVTLMKLLVLLQFLLNMMWEACENDVYREIDVNNIQCIHIHKR